jgi:hypothetical protein
MANQIEMELVDFSSDPVLLDQIDFEELEDTQRQLLMASGLPGAVDLYHKETAKRVAARRAFIQALLTNRV